MPETDKWEFKLNEKGDCLSGLATFNAAGCADSAVVAKPAEGETAPLYIPDELGVKGFQGGYYIAECTGTSFTVHKGDTEDAAKGAAGVKVTYDSTAGVVGCTAWEADGAGDAT